MAADNNTHMGDVVNQVLPDNDAETLIAEEPISDECAVDEEPALEVEVANPSICECPFPEEDSIHEEAAEASHSICGCPSPEESIHEEADINAEIWQAWQGVLSTADAAIQEGTAHFITGLRQSLRDRLALDALTYARLAQKDAGVYNHLVYLMETYQQVVHLFENIEEAPATDLVAGLCDILKSRLSQFEDTNLGQDNPVAKEKMAILEESILRITQQAEALGESCIAKIPYLPHLEAVYTNMLLGAQETAWQLLHEAITQDIGQPLQACYEENLHSCISAIDDLHTRKAASYYADLLEREWEVLGLIIQVQVKAIEHASKSTDTATPMLTRLREVYQQTGPVVSGFRKLMQSPPTEAYPGLLIETLVLAAPNPAEFDFSPLQSALKCKAAEMFTTMRESYLNPQHYPDLSGEDNLAKNIITAFENSQSVLAAQLSTLSEESTSEKEILHGITETLGIKIESLKESREQFGQSSEKLVGDMQNGLQTMPEGDGVTAALQLFEAWCAAPPTKDTIQDFLNERRNHGIFQEQEEKYTKVMAQGVEKAGKTIFRYRKETLLYEICTFEEILFYSVTRLRESTLPQIEEGVKILDETFATLESLLANKEITVIRPAPHEAFNGREHEVLTAEEQEGFAKGEIIKTMTSGYKQGDKVILRANVVAAR